jgi:aspartyl protease family protein
MVIKEAGVLAIATLSALAAGGGVMQMGAHAFTPPAREHKIPKAQDGHYWAMANVDGARVRFLVDTGSSAVALTPSDAVRLGVDTAHLSYNQPVFTAAGRERAAAVTLDHIDIDGTRVEHVSALVMRNGLPASLLGMSFLGRLSRIEVTPDALVLHR